MLDGATWYEERERGLGEQFVNEFESAVRQILFAPTSWAKVETVRTRRNIRRCFVKRFPYYIAYEIVGEQITVLAVAHAKRKPNDWIRRR